MITLWLGTVIHWCAKSCSHTFWNFITFLNSSCLWVRDLMHHKCNDWTTQLVQIVHNRNFNCHFGYRLTSVTLSCTASMYLCISTLLQCFTITLHIVLMLRLLLYCLCIGCMFGLYFKTDETNTTTEIICVYYVNVVLSINVINVCWNLQYHIAYKTQTDMSTTNR